MIIPIEILLHILSYSEISHYAIITLFRRDLLKNKNIIPYLWYHPNEITDDIKLYVRKIILADMLSKLDIASQITHIKCNSLPFKSSGFGNITCAYVEKLYYEFDDYHLNLRHIQCDDADFSGVKVHHDPYRNITSLHIRKSQIETCNLYKFCGLKRLKADIILPNTLPLSIPGMIKLDYWEGDTEGNQSLRSFSAKVTVNNRIRPKSMCIIS